MLFLIKIIQSFFVEMQFSNLDFHHCFHYFSVKRSNRCQNKGHIGHQLLIITRKRLFLSVLRNV